MWSVGRAWRAFWLGQNEVWPSLARACALCAFGRVNSLQELILGRAAARLVERLHTRTHWPREIPAGIDLWPSLPAWRCRCAIGRAIQPGGPSKSFGTAVCG